MRRMSNRRVKTMPEPEPLSRIFSSQPSRFLIGKDSHGRWVAQDERGLCGGLFVNRAEAIRFAMRETGRRPQAVILVPDVIELDMTRTGNPELQQVHRSPARRAA
jgi:hypothetical protein